MLVVSGLAAGQALTLYESGGISERLVQEARKEGVLNLYTSLTVEDMAALNAAFESRYGVKIRMWRGASEKLLQRALSEAKGARSEVDIFESNGPTLEALHRERLLQAVRSPRHQDLVPAALPAHREWVGSRLSVFVQAYNTALVGKAELPRTYAELAQPRWKGRLGIEASDEDWFAAVLAGLGEAEGLRLFRRIVAENGVSVRKGHTLLANLVASGEIALALTVYDFSAEQLKRKGAPLDWFVIAPAIARANGLALARRAPHPHAALLYYDYMVSDEAQRILQERGFMPASRRRDGPLAGVPMTIIDPALFLDQSERWGKLFETVFLSRAR